MSLRRRHFVEGLGCAVDFQTEGSRNFDIRFFVEKEVAKVHLVELVGLSDESQSVIALNISCKAVLSNPVLRHDNVRDNQTLDSEFGGTQVAEDVSEFVSLGVFSDEVLVLRPREPSLQMRSTHFWDLHLPILGEVQVVVQQLLSEVDELQEEFVALHSPRNA